MKNHNPAIINPPKIGDYVYTPMGVAVVVGVIHKPRLLDRLIVQSVPATGSPAVAFSVTREQWKRI